ncbi:hypothetical protein HYALB_00005732 [Hymenoscyphus albidus]|uniref:NB-ARC domain-containing protein n=1 Tax=Hymenoscyphus albidus TaxID=595503 RepID=A0A9N9LIZ5_9HELO|nr:hypothetical protein HYALB_00005732 [Hymenoscyphus albidus]
MGLQILHPPPDQNRNIDITSRLTLDIIAIHGLNGHHLRTWTSPTSQTLWHRDHFPQSIPHARIQTFGYDATAAFSTNTSGIQEHARDLLRCVSESRTQSFEKSRPLIFIAHSLGGLVLKQALVIASKSEGCDYGNIWTSTLGILFFGTPHRGSELASYGAQLARVPTALSMKAEPVLLHSLSLGSAILEKLNKEFRILMSNKGAGREVISFYETVGMVGPRLVVGISSATVNPSGEVVGWEIPVPVAGIHRGMCQFDTRDDPTYVTAVHSIKRMRDKAALAGLVKVENEFFLVPQGMNPHFTGRNEMRGCIRDALLGEEYIGERELKTFVLFGLGGSGKTQVALKFAREFRNLFWGVFFVDVSSFSIASEGFDNIAEALKIRKSKAQASSIHSVKDYLAGKTNWLLVIDNADDQNLDVSQFFPIGHRGFIILTTRNPDFVKYASAGSCCVERLSDSDAVSLLLKVSGLGEDSSTQESQDIRGKVEQYAAKVVDILGCLALAIAQAGAVIRQGLVNLEGFPKLYSKRKKELLEIGRFNSGIEHQRSVYTTWEISLKVIQEMNEARSLLAMELLKYFSFMHFDGIEESFFEAGFLGVQHG